jgi:hypothetical protein
MLGILIGSFLVSAVVADAADATDDASNSPGLKATFTGVTCPIATSELVDWSTDSWWYPTLSEDIEWADFLEKVEITPDSVMASGYLPWKEGWEPWEEFLNREEASWPEAFFRTILPSGQEAFVWVGSGIEHWFTANGTMDVEEEDRILSKAYEQLEEWAEEGLDVEQPQVEAALLWARARC